MIKLSLFIVLVPALIYFILKISAFEPKTTLDSSVTVECKPNQISGVTCAIKNDTGKHVKVFVTIHAICKNGVVAEADRLWRVEAKKSVAPLDVPKSFFANRIDCDSIKTVFVKKQWTKDLLDD